MDDQERKPDVFELSPEMTEVSRQMRNLHGEFSEELNAMRQKAMEAEQAFMEEHREHAMSLWAKIAEAYDLDPEQSFSSGEWYLDTQYVDLGRAFLCERIMSDQEKFMRAPVQGSA